MQNLTKPTKTKDITRAWHQIDVKDAVLGRTATQVANILMGKGKPYFAKNMDCGDYVVITNASAVKVTGNKEKAKTYTRYSGYPGGLHSARLEEVRAKDPRKIITHAVSGMLPKNKLRAQFLKRLYVYPHAEHPYADKFTSKVTTEEK